MGTDRMHAGKRASTLLALTTAVAGLALVATPAPVAQAAPGDGIVKVRVVQDFNGDGQWDDAFIEPGLAGVDVEVTDEAGTTQTLTTDGEGMVTIVGAPGTYRIVALNPDPATLDPAPAHEKTGTAQTPAANWLSPNEEFVTVAANRTVEMTTAFWDSNDYCQSNPLIVTACQPPMFNSGGGVADNATGDTLVTAPYRAEGADVAKTTLSTKADTGALYGIGYRKQDKRVFAGAFAKRGSAYGPGGPGAIYVTPAGGGPTTVWGTVPNVGSTAHNPTDTLPGGRLDWNFAPAVGKESLGDLDISEDGDDLQVINLFTRQLLVYDASAATMGAPTHVVNLTTNPGCAAGGDWRPAALGERHGVLYVGGVCTAESTQNPADMKAIVLTYDADTYAPIGKVMEQPLTARRQDNGGSGCGGRLTTTYRPWNDDGITCTNKSGQIPDPQAWMTDIVIENNGDLIIGFRDRTGDQMLGVNSIYFSDTTGTGGTTLGTVNYNNSGDINKACPDTSGMFVLDMNGACGVAPVPSGQTAGEYFTGDATVHLEPSFGGLALSRGERGVATTIMDPAGIFTQGYASISRGTGRALDSAGNGSADDPDEVLHDGANWGNRLTGADGFGKGQGIADMEVLCDFAPIQIGNRIWNDDNGDGVQDPGEEGIAGVTVNLYDDNGTLVATKVTNSRGEYYFDSVNDGVGFNTDYVVRLDKPEDYIGNGPLAAVGLTDADQGSGATADRVDSDGTVVNGFPDAAITTGNRGENDHTIDFGFKPASVRVGNYVWVDSDGDGIQDPGETGIEGVVLELTDKAGNPVTDINGDPVGPVTTDADGHYVFDNLPVLPAGDYYTVTIDQADPSTTTALTPYLPTAANQGADPAVDSSLWTANSTDLTTAGAKDLTLDFGFMPKPVSVGDLVWIDTDGDGVQDPGEPGIPGVTMTLLDPDGNEIGTTTTDANGFYVFTDLPVLQDPDDRYTVTVDNDQAALAPYKPTQPGQGTDPAADSSTGSATSGPLTTPDASDMTLDFGFVPATVSVGDFVWADTDRDGLQDTGEPGIEGVVMTLIGPDGNPVTDVHGDVVAPQPTDSDGKYSFDDLPVLPAGQHYTVTIDQDHPSTRAALSSYVPTAASAGSDEGADSSTWTAESGDLTNDGDRDPSLDFGFVSAAVSVGDLVWVDSDGDGLQDTGEPGIEGVVMTLTGPDGNPVTDVFGNPVGPVPTNADGSYSFDNLPTLPTGQHYTVTIDQTDPATEAALATYVPTVAGAGGDRGADSSTWTAESGDLYNDGDQDLSLDFGFVPATVSVGDFVWADLDRDGLQDAGEPGIEGVVMTLTGPDGKPVTDVHGNVVAPQATDVDGKYSFDDLPVLPGGQHYRVTIDRDAASTEAALADYQPTKAGVGADDGADSSLWSVESGDLTTDGDRDPTLDFGFVPTVSVGDLVWADTDRDGIQDPGEPGIPGVVMTLTGPDGKPVTDVHGDVVAPVKTDADGKYSFDNLPTLPAGQHYTVSIDRKAPSTKKALEPYQPTKAGQGGDRGADSSTWRATSGDLTDNGDRDASLDFGFAAKPVSVGNSVWIDKDKDGKQDRSEKGIPGVVLELTGPDGKPVTDLDGNPVGPVTTDRNGHYLFTNLPPLPKGKSYTVSIDRDADSTKAALADYQPTKAGLDSWTWQATSGDLSNPNASDLTLDFGFVPVEEPAAPAPTTPLPDTGNTVPLGWLITGAWLLIAGAALLLFGRRRTARS